MSKENKHHNPNRRDVLMVGTVTAGAVIGGSAVVRGIGSLTPNEIIRAAASIEVDISSIEPGQQITQIWKNKPVFIKRQTQETIAEASEVAVSTLKDPSARNENYPADADATYTHRTIDDAGEWIVMIGLCTHFGCVPAENQGDFNGWYCPCHGSHYDKAGRIRKGPAPRNLDIPYAKFINGTTLQIGKAQKQTS